MPSAVKRPLSVKHPPFECIALLLQGGGALGAYQGGAYEALAEAGITPNWVAGISIGAINSAIIAGNPPETRVEKLREFWEGCSVAMPFGGVYDYEKRFIQGDKGRTLLNQTYASVALTQGVPNFFTPRLPPPYFADDGTPGATSYYDTKALKSTLERLVDFDRINANEMHLSVSAVNIETGNSEQFDSETHTILPEHIMASGALPPGFPAVEIDGQHYWDGGLLSNTPLEWVLDRHKRQDTLAFQIDLWSSRGMLPRNVMEVATRQKEILYSSRTRAATDRFKHAQRLKNAAATLISQLPSALRETPEAALIAEHVERKVYNIVHLIYRTQAYEGDSKDYEFSRRSMEEHWKAGYRAVKKTLKHPEILRRPTNNEGVNTFDLCHAEGAPASTVSLLQKKGN